MDNFIVSARKYRPVTFESVVGQNHITSTLRNAIARGQLAHAYLFCGPRGVGKTTCARIFAKAINCLSPHGSDACGECESCRAFDEGRSLNIHELDAASNNSVDDIRSLTEQVRIPPQTGRYSVYIIDEVHMLSQSAFNAFLKTLEEPPAHAVFILATTEKHKIIPTILSRCQIYDFNRIRVEDAVGYLKHIAASEGIECDDESLHLIAAKADGGMRDALSMFDKAVAFCGSRLDFRDVARTLNVLDYDTYFNLTSLAAVGDYRSALLLFDEVLRKGFSAQTLVGGMAGHLRDLLMCRDAATQPLLDATGSLLERYKTQSAQLDTAFLFGAVDLMNTADSTLRTATNTRLHVELALMKLCGLGQKKKNLEDEAPALPPLNGAVAPAVPATPATPATCAAATAPAAPAAPSVSAGSDTAVPPSPRPVPPAQGPAVRTTPASSVIHPSVSSPEPAGASRENASGMSSLADGNVSGRPDTVAAARVSSGGGMPPVRSDASHTGKALHGRSLSGVSISDLLNGETAFRANPGDEEVSLPVTSRGVDPDCEGKIAAHRDEFLGELRRTRPRMASALENMTVSGNRITAVVSTQLLREDILTHQKELTSMLRDMAGVEGAVEYDIQVKEIREAVKPIKPEDKLAWLRNRNPQLDELRRELDLDIE